MPYQPHSSPASLMPLPRTACKKAAYGFAELSAGQGKPFAAQRVANPGYATGAIALLRPLVEAGVLPPSHPVTLPAVSGYSGGGRQMIEAYERGEAPPYFLYALGLAHKHIPEIMHYSRMQRQPVFTPSVGNFAQGMLAVALAFRLAANPARHSAFAGDLPSVLRGQCQRKRAAAYCRQYP